MTPLCSLTGLVVLDTNMYTDGLLKLELLGFICEEMDLECGQRSLNRCLRAKLSVFTICSFFLCCSFFEQQQVKVIHNHSLKGS